MTAALVERIAAILLEDLTELLPGEGVTGEDCERIIDIWAERAHEHIVGVAA